MGWIEKHFLAPESPVRDVVEKALSDHNFYVGVAALLGTILIPVLAQRRKKLFFDVICTLKLFDEAIRLLIPPDEDPEDGELTMVIIDVQNSTSGFFGGFGGVDINTEQYKHNVSFNFGDNAQVLSATMLDKHPSDVEELVDPKTFPQDKLTLAPILLNQGDWIRLGAVVQTPANTAERSPRVVTANGRIMGIRRIQKKRPPGSLAWLSLGLAQAPFVLIFLFTVAGFLFEWMFGRQFPDLSDAFFLYVLAWAATFYLFTAFLGLLSLRRYIRKWRVAQRFSHLTPESWAPAVVRISGLFILVVALEATIMTLVFAGRLSIASFLVVLVVVLVLIMIGGLVIYFGARFSQRRIASIRKTHLLKNLQ